MRHSRDSSGRYRYVVLRSRLSGDIPGLLADLFQASAEGGMVSWIGKLEHTCR